MNNALVRLPPNTRGRDFFLGDLHGCYDLLMHHLNVVDFNFQKDRLISVGDLADRGPSSEECVSLINESWFYAVRGNHEDMCIGVHRGNWSLGNFMMNGGTWFTDLQSYPDRQEKIVQLMETLPLILEVPVGDKLIGVLHADATEPSWKDYREGSYSIEQVIWGRRKISQSNKTAIEGVDAVVVGHTPVQYPQTIGNVLYIDTGAVYGKGLTIIEASQVLALTRSSI